jgi:hypothetical protein
MENTCLPSQIGIKGPRKIPSRVKAGQKHKQNLKGQKVYINVNQEPGQNREDSSKDAASYWVGYG